MVFHRVDQRGCVHFAEGDGQRWGLLAMAPQQAIPDMDKSSSWSERMIVLVGCGSKKRDKALPAKDLYLGGLVRTGLARACALAGEDAVFIVSAKHGLLALDEHTEPYELSLRTMPRTEREAWGNRVAEQLAKRGVLGARFVALMGETYVALLRRSFGARGWFLEEPLRGVRGIGNRIRVLQGDDRWAR